MRAGRMTSGFTLVEMLVAIALLGLVGVISWRGLDYVTGQRERIDRDTEDLSRILRVLSQLERDVVQRAPDAVLAPQAAPGLLPASIAVLAAENGAVALEIVRIAPGAGGPARVQRIVYRIAGAGLTRGASPAGTGWPVAPAADPVAMLPDARQLAVRAYADGSWSELKIRESGARPPTRATGLEVTIEDRDGARYTRVFAL
jgi:general secretion pathway protein J